jgi:hypothetical protein
LKNILLMAEELKNSNLISKTNSGFPGYLDFEKLRKEGIDHLGKLAGKLWTDHNVHDPGITILEVLCYALLDLGYRTNLPEADILTRPPEDKSKDDNFFTPAAILSCNPLTITDFRKLLIDIEGVKNAWLEIATDERDICRPSNPNDAAGNIREQGFCLDYLNGLYHVSIDLDKDVEKEFRNEPDAKKEYVDNILEKIKIALMAHRNLCEDFVDISILCKQEIGVCADIELEEGVDVEKVYLAVVETLRDFFSPAPQFYTLQQLLDRNKPIEDIFAGRPYNIEESHGFVDTAELELLKLRKEIHLSDVYNVLFKIEGVKNVRDLRLQSCKDNIATTLGGWKYQIPKNHIPEFSVTCSGFQFSRFGMPVLIDFKKFDGLFEINFAHNGKILFKSPSPYLDSDVPRGIYRNDLKDYYSIQNEFPRVYGIAEGGLPGNVSNQRKAEAYQLKAYLLFFDQLLANYLTQLSHIRSLFALSPTDDSQRHSYFINQIDTVPDLQKLLRFNVSETTTNPLGTMGSILVLPVDKNHILQLKEEDKLKTLDLESIVPYTFDTLADQDMAINQVKIDLQVEQFQCECVSKNDECVFYYILTSSNDIVLLSKKYFSDTRKATEHATSVKYIGTFEENYRSFITADKHFSFDIELNLLAFSKYLELIVEDKTLFHQRRQGFLDHLLARFAEQFTDYATLSFGSSQFAAREIKKKEALLSSYDEISSNRGKAYDYLENGWNNKNVSGFEKKFKAISGIDNWKRHSLCNFVVAEYDPQYAAALKLAGTEYFSTEERFESKEEALVAAHSVFKALADKSNYTSYEVPYDKSFRLKIKYAEDKWAEYPAKFNSKEDSVAVATNITNLFKERSPDESVFESAYVYVPVLKDVAGKDIRKSIQRYPSDEDAISGALKAAKKIDDRKLWAYEEGQSKLGIMYHDRKKSDVLSFINTDAFKIDVGSNIVGKPDKFTYDLLDKGNNFKVTSVKEFDDDDNARANASELLALLADEANYQISVDDKTGRALLRIVNKDDVQAISSIESASPNEAENLKKQIIDIVRNHQYSVVIEKIPHRWRFSYQLGYAKNNVFLFQSVKEYDSPEEATEAAGNFNKAVPTLEVEEDDKELTLVPKKSTSASAVRWMPQSGNSPKRTIEESITKLLEEQKEIKRLSANPTPEAFSSSVDIDEVSKQGLFVYRVVDKDRIMASYTETFPDKDSASAQINAVVKRFKKSVNYLQLCMGGDIIVERKHPVTNATWYRYQIRCLNQFYKSGDLAGRPLILFESVARFTSRDEAEKAFAENYSEIIRLASEQSNYEKTIGLVEIPVDAEDRQVKSENIVFIPKETLADLGNSTDASIPKIIELLLTYPIRSVIYKSREFYRFFPCEKDDEPESTDCKKKKEKYVYYFVLQSSPDNKGWQSLTFYDTPKEARKEFDFFLILLYYPGNYYVDCDHCQEERNQYQIFIREVLAESTERFVSEEQAWGKEGVEKFICVSQAENTFHTYRRKEDCCYSFYVACGTGFIYHPCKYDTSQRRDEVSLKMYRSLSDMITKKAWQTEDNKEELELTDGEGKAFAVIRSNARNSCVSDRVSGIMEYAHSNENYKDVDGRIVLVNAQNQTLASSVQEGITLSQWRGMLQLFMCYYPIIKVKDETGGDNNKYCIEIRLPGFNSCKDDATEEKPCGCGNEPARDTSDCYIAWKGNCCYRSCAEAERAWQVIVRLLLQFEYYQPVFDCECYAHGIALQFSSSITTVNRNSDNERLEVLISNWRSSQIIAINPQCYPNKEYACDAVDRAKRLVNSEGLHLVEHILLRPRCFPEDCRCPQYINQCDTKTDCKFVWKVPDDDPCSDEEDICFIPGADRYSFIATVALPAWPERFRKPANRRLLENILYRETPAHILLRILWLTPHDFCCFESKFKKWNRWLAMKKNCVDDFTVCDFMEFLFDRNYECLSECVVCEPCEDNVAQRQPCFAQAGSKLEVNFIDQVNELYCWKVQDCEGEFRFIPCERRHPDTPTPILELAVHSRPFVEIVSEKVSPPAEPAIEKKAESTSSEAVVSERKEEAIPAPSTTTSKRKSQVVNSRMTKYKTSVLQIAEKSNNNPLVAKVQSLITDPRPTQDRLEKLVNEILQNKAPKVKGVKKLTKVQVNDLVKNCISYYLDKVCFNGKDMEKVKDLKKIVEKVRKAKIKVEAIYDYWDPKEIKKYEPTLDETEIDKLFDRNVK